MKSFTVVQCEQRSGDWYHARCGRLTGSVAAQVLAKGKGSEEAVGRRDLRLRLVCERLTDRPQEDGNGYTNDAMTRGIELEPAARRAYESRTGELVETTGFLSHMSLFAGCSLDGHVGDYETVVSIKCPKSATHLGYLRGSGFPSTYVPQMLHELWITGAQFYDFLSFDDRFPAHLQVFYVRVPRDSAAVAQYAEKAMAFLAEVDAEYAALTFEQQLAASAGGK